MIRRYKFTPTGFCLWLMYADDDKLRNTLISIGIWLMLFAPVAHYITTGSLK